jgi:hypothetical protein
LSWEQTILVWRSWRLEGAIIRNFVGTDSCRDLVDLWYQFTLYYTSHLYNTRSFCVLYCFNHVSSCTSYCIINIYFVVSTETKLRFESSNNFEMYYNWRDIRFHWIFLHLGNILLVMLFSSKMFLEACIDGK